MMRIPLPRPGAQGPAVNSKRMKKFLWLLLLLCLPPGGVQAEKADRSKPIHVESDRVTVDDIKQLSVFDGNVVLTQGTMTLRGDRMEVRQDKEGFKQGTVWGKRAYFRQKRDGVDEWIEAWAERVEYDSRADKLQLFVRAALKRGEDDVLGDYISYDATTEFFQVIGGGAKAASDNNPEGRVRTIMQPKTKPPAQPAPPQKAALPLKSADGIAAPRTELVAPK
jgi:lipopolysaccharide export system protein LptA